MLSHFNDEGYTYKNILDHNLEEIITDDRTFRLSKLSITVDGKVIGSAKIVFEITDSIQTIKNNRDLTFTLVLVEILFSMILAYIIGHRLTNSLNILTSAAGQIAQDDQIIIPNVGKQGDEIYILSNALHIMQERIAQRNSNMNYLVKKLQDSTALIQKERDFHSALLNQASSLIVVMNNKGEVVLTNKAVETLTGYTQSEVEGKIVWDIFIPKEIRPKVQEVFLNLVAGDFPSSYENAWIVKDGSQVPFAWSNSCIVDDKGEIEYVITVGIDMTERNKKEQTIQALLNSPSVFIVLISIDETILEINEVAVARLKAKNEELKGKKLFDYTSQESSQLRREYIDELIVTKKRVVYEEKENGYVYKNHLYPILDEKGNIMQISIFSHDITPFYKAQKELDKYIKLVDENVMISHADTKGITTSVSKAFCKITGYTAKELIGQKYNIIRHPDIPTSLYDNLWNTIKKGKVWHGEIKNQNKNGEAYWVETAVYPDFDEEGNIIGYNAIRQDITSKKLLEELSIMDSLTKLYNRRCFDDVFDKEIKRIKREKKIFCLLSLDVDDFKMYNDTYGHQMGDNVLVTIGAFLKEHMRRSGDMAFRIGGEEFSAIYSADDEKSAYDFANSIRQGIENKKIEHKTNRASPYVTVSIGVIFIDFKKNRSVVIDQAVLYNHADELLYIAKEKGRNTVEIVEKRE
ncbi:PAS domain S-box protein [bacterium]|nr:PAS domain S-box protein [bacterium]